ncbi:MAG: hypothetical protein JWL60_119 [Gemmatimonadetes bacterium]|jgi:hypothetical protein|nr:hypothetical protein [Gemmatimonadota bacterium]
MAWPHGRFEPDLPVPPESAGHLAAFFPAAIRFESSGASNLSVGERCRCTTLAVSFSPGRMMHCHAPHVECHEYITF